MTSRLIRRGPRARPRPKRARLLLALAAAGWACAAARASSDAPLGVGTPGTFRMLFLDMPLADARVPAAAELRWWMANDWSTPTAVGRGRAVVTIRNDEQADVLVATVPMPWSGRGAGGEGLGRPWLSTWLEGRLLVHWGGWTDAGIEDWHHLIGSVNFQRSLYPRNQVHLLLRSAGPGGALLDLSGPQVAVGDLAVRNQLVLAEGGPSPIDPARARWALALRADLKVPIGSLSLASGSRGWDAGIGIAASAELTRWLTGHAMLSGAVWSGLPASFPLQPRTWHGGADVSLVARLGGWALILEDRALTPLFEGGWSPISGDMAGVAASALYAGFRPHNQVSWGVRRGGFTLFMSEDFTLGSNPSSGARWFFDSNAPDVVLGLAWTLEH